jgi:predicted transcriptional regulator
VPIYDCSKQLFGGTDMAEDRTPTYVRIPTDLLEKLDKIAIDQERSRNWVINKMLEKEVALYEKRGKL